MPPCRLAAVPLASLLLACLPLACVTLATQVRAQTAVPPAKAKHKPDPYGSPLGTIMSSHLWTDVPQAQDFVRDTRPAPKDLKFTPLTGAAGADPERPKPRDAANVQALQAELEKDMARNKGRGGGLAPVPKPHRSRKAAGTE